MGESVKQWTEKKGMVGKDVRHGKWLFTPDNKAKLKGSYQLKSMCMCLRVRVGAHKTHIFLKGSPDKDHHFHHNYSM